MIAALLGDDAEPAICVMRLSQPKRATPLGRFSGRLIRLWDANGGATLKILWLTYSRKRSARRNINGPPGYQAREPRVREDKQTALATAPSVRNTSNTNGTRSEKSSMTFLGRQLDSCTRADMKHSCR